MADISVNLAKIKEGITRSAAKSGRLAEDITLVTVTKLRSQGEILELKQLGVKLIGENRSQELIQKYNFLKDNFDIHFIGHLQTNKVKQVVKMVSMIQSVDSIKLASTIDKECRKIGKTMDVLMEVNTSGEEAKFGVKPENLFALLKEAAPLAHVNILGLMTMAMFTDDQERIRQCFSMLRQLKEQAQNMNIENIRMRHLSMGMTNDYETAIEEGATMVRIGSAVFEGD
jgi:pyridoxal phosphate enzyme (YggS family)